MVIADGAGGEIPDTQGIIVVQQRRVDLPLAQNGHAAASSGQGSIFQGGHRLGDGQLHMMERGLLLQFRPLVRPGLVYHDLHCLIPFREASAVHQAPGHLHVFLLHGLEIPNRGGLGLRTL